MTSTNSICLQAKEVRKMEENKHALLSASTAHRWLACTPSARLELEENTEECSVYAAEGTEAHELAEILLSKLFNKITKEEYITKREAFMKKSQYFTAEFEEYVNDYVHYVVEQTSDLGDYHIFFELKVPFSNVVPQGYGTVDTVIVTKDTIHIIDLKFGRGIPVTAINNPQLRLYGFGALNLFPRSKQVRMTIHQPRLNSIDHETLSKEELIDWAINEVKPRAELAIKGDGKLRPTEEACRFCKLKGKCKARADLQLEQAKREFAIVNYKQDIAHTITPEQISTILDIAPAFIDWFKDVQAYALAQLIAGEEIPGYKLVEGRSNRIMTDPNKIKEILMETGVPEEMLMKPAELLGISKLEQLVGKKLFEELCGNYLEKPAGKLTMAKDDDKRPRMSVLSVAQRDFS